jgi:spore coat protein U-like protein
LEISAVFTRYHFSAFMALAAMLSLVPVTVMAGTNRGQFLVSVTVVRECSVNVQGLTTSATASGRNNATASGAVALSCSKNTAYNISLGSAARLGDTTGPDSVAGVGNGRTQVIPVSDQIPVQNGNVGGAQASTVIMTINY